MSHLIPRYNLHRGGLVQNPSGAFILHDDVAKGAVIVSAHELNRLLESAQVLDWLSANVTHMEHGPRALEDGYWPHTLNDEDPFRNFFGATLREYVLRRIAGERGQKDTADTPAEPEAELCPACCGSGEGWHDGSTCAACHGGGEIHPMRAAA